MNNKIDHTLEMPNRVYDTEGLSPTISTMGGGERQPKTIRRKKHDKTIF